MQLTLVSTPNHLQGNRSQYGNYGNSLSHFFDKNFVKPMFFTKGATKELISRNIFSVRENFLLFHTESMKYPHAYFVQFSAIYFSGRTITTFQYTIDKKQEQNIAAILLHIKTIQSISIFCKL